MQSSAGDLLQRPGHQPAIAQSLHLKLPRPSHIFLNVLPHPGMIGSVTAASVFLAPHPSLWFVALKRLANIFLSAILGYQESIR